MGGWSIHGSPGKRKHPVLLSPSKDIKEQSRNYTKKNIPPLLSRPNIVSMLRTFKESDKECMDEYDSDSSETTSVDEELPGKGTTFYIVGTCG